MNLSGIQYYWLIFSGLIISLALVILGINEELQEKLYSNITTLIPLTILSIYAVVCYFALVFEMWERYKFKLVYVIIIVYLAGEYVHHLLTFLYEIIPLAYWVWRINGVEN